MARTWLSIEVKLLGGHGEELLGTSFGPIPTTPLVLGRAKVVDLSGWRPSA